MSDNERMDRAKRIRRMREGRRDEEDDEESREPVDDADGPEPAEAEDPGPAGTDSDESEPAGNDGGGGPAAEPADESADQPATEAPADQVTASADEDESLPESVGEETRAELPDAEKMEAALEEAGGEVETAEEAAGPAAGIAGEAVESSQEADTRVLEFTLGDEQYGLDIEYIEEIVKQETITRVPNTPDFVEGVVDLRGQITTILNPKVTIGKDDTSRGDLIVVFDSEAFDDQHIGWVVDDVRQVAPVHDEDVNDPPMEESYINGVIDREDEQEFVIWTTPDLALDEAES